jgi:hypothetical protein
MTPAMQRSLSWLPGPLLAGGLVLFAFVFKPLAGLFALCLVGAVAFLFGAPLVQLILLSTHRFRGKYASACGTALGLIIAILVSLVLFGLFNFA